MSTIALVDSFASAADASSYSKSCALGTPSSDRIIIVGVSTSRVSGTASSLSATLDGAAMTSAAEPALIAGRIVHFFYLAAPTGSTGTVVVSSSAALRRLGFAVYAATGTDGIPSVTNATFAGTVATLDADVSPSASSLAVAISYNSRGNPRMGAASGILPSGSTTISATGTASDVSWSRLTEDDDLLLEALSGDFDQALAVLTWAEAATSGPTVTPNSATHTHAATSPTATPKSTISADNSAHGHAATTPTLSAKSAIAPNSASHDQASTSPTLSASGSITVDSAGHTHGATSPTVAVRFSIAVDSAGHGQSATSPAITFAGGITVDSASHGHAATSPSISVRYNFSPDSALHQHNSTSPTVSEGGAYTPVLWLSFAALPKELEFDAKPKVLTFEAKGAGMKDEIITTKPKHPSEIWTINLRLNSWQSDSIAASDFAAASLAGSVSVTGFELVDAENGKFTITGGSPKEIARLHAYANLSNGDRFSQVFHIPVL